MSLKLYAKLVFANLKRRHSRIRLNESRFENESSFSREEKKLRTLELLPRKQMDLIVFRCEMREQKKNLHLLLAAVLY